MAQYNSGELTSKTGRTKSMRKTFFSFLLIVVTAFTLDGCGQKTSVSDPKNELNSTTTTKPKSSLNTNDLTPVKFEIAEIPSNTVLNDLSVVSPYGNEVKASKGEILAPKTSQATTLVLGLDKQGNAKLIDFVVPDVNPNITLSNESTARSLIFVDPIFWSLDIDTRKKIFSLIPSDPNYINLVNLVKKGESLESLAKPAHQIALQIYKKISEKQEIQKKKASENIRMLSQLRMQDFNIFEDLSALAAVPSKIYSSSGLSFDASMLSFQVGEGAANLKIINNSPLAYRYVVAPEGSISIQDFSKKLGWNTFTELDDNRYASPSGESKDFFVEDRDFLIACLPFVCIPSPASPNSRTESLDVIKSTQGRETFSVYFSAFVNKGNCDIIENRGASNALCRNFTNIVFDILTVFLGHVPKESIFKDKAELLEKAVGMVDFVSKCSSASQIEQVGTCSQELLKYIFSLFPELDSKSENSWSKSLGWLNLAARIESAGSTASRFGFAVIQLPREGSNNFPEIKVSVQGITSARTWQTFKEDLRNGNNLDDLIVDGEYTLPDEFEKGKIYLNRESNALNGYVLKQGVTYAPNEALTEIIEKDGESLVTDGKAIKFVWKGGRGISLLADKDGFYYKDNRGCIGTTCLTSPKLSEVEIKNILLTKRPIQIKPFNPVDIVGEWKPISNTLINRAFSPTLLFFEDGAVEVRIQNGFAGACSGKYRFIGANVIDVNVTGATCNSIGSLKIVGSATKIRLTGGDNVSTDYEKVTSNIKRNCYSKGVCF